MNAICKQLIVCVCKCAFNVFPMHQHPAKTLTPLDSCMYHMHNMLHGGKMPLSDILHWAIFIVNDFLCQPPPRINGAICIWVTFYRYRTDTNCITVRYGTAEGGENFWFLTSFRWNCPSAHDVCGGTAWTVLTPDTDHISSNSFSVFLLSNCLHTAHILLYMNIFHFNIHVRMYWPGSWLFPILFWFPWF